MMVARCAWLNMPFVLRLKLFANAAQLTLDALELMPGGFALLVIYLGHAGSGQPPLRPVHNRRHHLQIADEFGASAGRGLLFRCLTLRFEEQLGRVQNPFAHRRRTLSPGRIQLPSRACVAMVLGEDGSHALAIVQALARCRHQKLQRHLRQDLAFPNLLLDCFRQHLHQRQPTRNPTHAAVKASR
jgi:hypothetical protein